MKNRSVGNLDIKKNIKLLSLCPVASAAGAGDPVRMPPYEYLLESTSVDKVFCENAPDSIFSQEDAAEAAPHVVEKAKWAASQRYDAIVINCMLDPGLKEARQAVAIPVIGIREATLAFSAMMGNCPAVIYPDDIPVPELADDEARTFSELVRVGMERIENDHADVLILGCSLLGGLAQKLQTKLKVPVLPNLDLGLRAAESIVAFRIMLPA